MKSPLTLSEAKRQIVALKREVVATRNRLLRARDSAIAEAVADTRAERDAARDELAQSEASREALCAQVVALQRELFDARDAIAEILEAVGSLAVPEDPKP